MSLARLRIAGRWFVVRHYDIDLHLDVIRGIIRLLHCGVVSASSGGFPEVCKA